MMQCRIDSQRSRLSRRVRGDGPAAGPAARLHRQRRPGTRTSRRLRARIRHVSPSICQATAQPPRRRPGTVRNGARVADLPHSRPAEHFAGSLAWLLDGRAGRAAVSASRHPRGRSALVLEGASPGIADPAERAARSPSDERWPIRSSARADGVCRSLGAPTALRHPGTPASRDARGTTPQRLKTTRSASPTSLRGIGQGAQPPFHDQTRRNRVPTLLLVGEEDANSGALAAEMAAVDPGTPAWKSSPKPATPPHLEQPEHSTIALISWSILRSAWSFAGRMLQ